MVADVLRQVAHVPLLGWGSLVVSSVEHILALEGETEEAVEPSPALSSTGSYGSTLLFHGWSICFQNHTTCQFVEVPYMAVGSASGDIVMLDGLLRILHISLALAVA